MDNNISKIENWDELPEIMIFMLGIISSMKQFKNSTHQEVWETVKKDFQNIEKVLDNGQILFKTSD